MTDTNIDRNQHIARRKPLFGALHLLALLLLVVHASESLTAATISITVLPPPRQPENANGEVVLPDRGGRRGSSTLEERIQNSKDEYAASQQEQLHAAAPFPYVDVPEGSWFRSEVEFMLSKDVLDETRTHFEPHRPVNRAESAKILAMLHGMEDANTPARRSFSDVDVQEWYARPLHYVAKRGWFKGEDNCYRTQPDCYVYPNNELTRAQAVAILLRYSGTDVDESAVLDTDFRDVPSYAWYRTLMESAVDQCMVRGDDETGLLRPNDPVSRAEFVVMVYRLDTQFDDNCEPIEVSIEEFSSESSIETQSSDPSSQVSSAPLVQTELLVENVPEDNFIQEEISMGGLQCDACHLCGAGHLNVCTANECAALGDCVAEPHLLLLTRCVPDTLLCRN